MPDPKYQQRDHIYVVGPPLLPTSAPVPQLPNETPALTTLAAGAQIIGLPVTLDKDAPFILRRRALRIQYDTSATGKQQETGINQLMVRFTDRDHAYLSQSIIPQNLDGAYFGQFGQWKPVFPGVPYPAGGTFLIDIVNNGTTTLHNVTLYFRGVKLYPWGVRPDYRYPKTMATLPYAYPINQVTPSNQFGVVQSLGVSEVRYSQVFQVKDDADFVIRSMATGPVFSDVTFEVFLQLRDFDQKPYSTGWVHLDVYGGQSAIPVQIQYPIGSGHFITAVGAGASLPNVFFPELYVPKNQILFYDILRQDSAFNGIGAIAQDYPITMVGAKVFSK